MNRIILQDQTLSNAAHSRMAPATGKAESGFAALARFLGAVLAAARGYIARKSVERQLKALDDRLLADIGLTRGEIPAAAKALAGAKVDLFAETSRLVVRLVIRPLAQWKHRRDVYNQLMSLDDRMLADIGLTRFGVAEFVAKLGREIEPALPVALRAMEHDMTAPLRAWRVARVTEKALTGLSDRQLRDIGVMRTDIVELAETLAEKALLAANGNRPAAPLKAA